MKRLFLFLLLLAFGGFAMAQNVVAPSWESINERGYPQWFRDAKLGIFIHWGLYSVPAYASPEGYGEWFYRGLMLGDEGRRHALDAYAPNPSLDIFPGIDSWPDSLQVAFRRYAALRDCWHGEKWNPDEWASLFQRAGARYVLLVSKHHDGYCLWNYPNTAFPDWNSVESGPRRDIVGELAHAVRQKNIKMGLYFSLTEWTNPMHTWTLSPNDSIGRYVDEFMIPQFKDLVEHYRPSVIFTDGEWDNNAEQFHAKELISWYYNTVGPDAVVNDRWGDGHLHGFRTPEYSGGILDTTTPWAECRGIGRSFGVNHNERVDNFISNDDLISHFVQLVAAGGGLTLNVGPEADGTIPFAQQERLLALGKWLDLNGEAIYASRPYLKPFEYNELWDSVMSVPAIDFDWVRNAPFKGMSCDSFSVVWQGEIAAEYSEDYTFEVEVDDEMALFLDDKKILDYRKSAPAGSQSNAQEATNYSRTSVTVPLEAGVPHSLRVEYREFDLEARAKLYWQSPSLPKSVVRPKEGFQGRYQCLLPSVCYTRKGDVLYVISLIPPVEPIRLHNLPPDIDVKKVSARLLCDPSAQVTLKRTKGKANEVSLQMPRLSRHDYEKIMESQGAWVFALEGALK